jgi:hypothetical protein
VMPSHNGASAADNRVECGPDGRDPLRDRGIDQSFGVIGRPSRALVP